jgi:type 1 fimbria pilin
MKQQSSTYSNRGSLGGCKILLLLLCATALVSFSANKPFTDFSGKWYSGSANSSFDIKLIQVKGRVSGSHCAIQLGGSKVDCVLKDNDVTIIGNANNSTSVKVTFISQFSQKKGTATITKMNDSTLQWRIITKPKGEYYLPNQMVLKKR